MTITREQIADLRPGDVVEVHMENWREGVRLRGPLHEPSPGTLWLGDLQIRFRGGHISGWLMGPRSTLTVLSRAPRPLYVNHPRTKPVDGDVVSQGDLLKDPGDVYVWYSTGWLAPGQLEPIHPDSLRPPLRLLVDGETGQAVPQ